MKQPATHVVVDGIVAMRDKLPYIRLMIGDTQAQLSMADARKVAADIVQMAARTEADAMVYAFFSAEQYPEGAAAALMHQFRQFRLKLDQETVSGSHIEPETRDTIKE
jgi:cell fate (sporulation/competence/biofilm development) regulator YlbF (YheA/YmcA/DUF963 family)